METIGSWWMWAGFAVFVVIACAVDLLVLQKKGSERVSIGQALRWSALWVALALVFNGLLWWYVDGEAGREIANAKAAEFFTGYLIEKSLAVDNIFVFLMLFTYFAVPAQLQKRVLILGVIGAIVLRAVMILIGAWLIKEFHWVLYLFGAFLLATGIKMLIFADASSDLEKNPLLKWMRGHMNLTPDFDSEKFWVTRQGVRFYTPLFVVMILIGITDVVFAVDSIPAIFAITEDPFIVMTSNIFAILGLRAMYFLLADLKDRFHLLTYGLGVILVFVGAKMLIVDWIKIPVGTSLGVVGAILAVSMVASLLTTRVVKH
ncbi:TerC family protein [Alcaligenaceae bacterium LF4-65]|jgi:tellurite resistance protein TerC|uniref:TerC family protein n=1 Tax=Zwartia hollandica TaxID=324606 RepID=A0A953N9I9_9BURK|nr:TerC family protein [Zwartia hollandica]MBZ1350458.1 TerC family protein [Zwartia hollandica]